MGNRILFVDLENVQDIDLSIVPIDVRVMIFYGTMQKKIPEGLVVQAQPFGSRLKWLKVLGQGPNALDFHIAFYLGQELKESPASECVIFSRDTGFDPLIRHLQSIGCTGRRVASLGDAFSVQEDFGADHFPRLLTLLKKEKARPAKRRGLMGKVKSWFPQLSEGAQVALLNRLFDEAHVREADKRLAYDL